jgi:hypothetical protein
MKIILPLLALFTLAAPTFGQSAAGARPKGFLNVDWGATPAATVTALRSRGALIDEDEEYSLATREIVANGGNFAGQDVTTWRCEFTEGQLARASVTLKSTGNAQSLYRELKQMLAGKYGPATAEKKLDILTPEERRSRLSVGYTRMPTGNVTQWKFGTTLNDKSELSIALELGPPGGPGTSVYGMEESNFAVTVRYANETLVTRMLKAARAQPEPPKETKPVKSDDL